MYSISDRAVVREQGGRAFLLHVDTGRYYELNRTGLLVWKALAQGHEPAHVMATSYPSVEGGKLARDVQALLDDLLDADLILRDPPSHRQNGSP